MIKKTLFTFIQHTTSRNYNTQSLQYTAVQGRTKLTVNETGISQYPMKEASTARQK